MKTFRIRKVLMCVILDNISLEAVEKNRGQMKFFLFYNFKIANINHWTT